MRPRGQLARPGVVAANTPIEEADLVLTVSSARSRATPAFSLAVLAATLLAATAPRAGAAAVASSARGFEGGPALASDGRVVVGELRGNGALAILAVDPATHGVTQVGAFAPLSDPLTYNNLGVSGTGGAVTTSLIRWREATGVQSGPEQDIPVPKSSRVMTILPAVSTLFACSRRGRFSEPDAAGGDGFVASIGDECAETSTAVTIRTAGATLTIPAAAETPFAGDPPTPNITSLRAAGPMVAWVEQHRAVPGGVISRTIVVARGATGQVLLRTPIPEYPSQVGLGADGTVAFTGVFCALGVVSPAAPRLRTIKLPPDLCAYSQSARSLAVAGERIVYGASTGYAILDLREAAPRPLADARPRGGNVGSPVAFDGSTVFVVRPDCDADRLFAIDADAAAGPLPTREQTQERPCPVRRSGSGRVRVGHDGLARVALRCAEGCRGTLRLVQQRRGRRERLIGEATYFHGAGTVVVRVRVATYARALAGCSGGLRATATVFPSRNSPRTLGPHGIGAYRLTSSARCRRTGGPPFTRPRRGPRP
jgi:hypothetical protein